jgi:nucleotide-binding universal stress UspA family protein
METLKILIPTDFTVQAEFAYQMVKRLQEKIPVELHFLHVLEVPETVTINKDGRIETCGEIDVSYVQSQKGIAERKLKELVAHYGASVHTHLVAGKVTDQILLFSRSASFDLIAMGRKGAWGLKEKISGSETQMVARQSLIPVLSLMCDRSDLILEHILLVHDFHAPKEESPALLHRLIKAFQPKVHLLQITGSSDPRSEHTVFEDMDRYAALNQLVNYEKHVLTDTDIEKGVVHFYTQQKVDIVCIGTHGKGGLFHKSATEKLINHLFKPIISYHLSY